MTPEQLREIRANHEAGWPIGNYMDAIRTLLDAIAERDMDLSGANVEIERLRERLRPGSPTERAPTEWAYNAACKALEKAKATIAERDAEIERLREALKPKKTGSDGHVTRLTPVRHKGGRS